MRLLMAVPLSLACAAVTAAAQPRAPRPDITAAVASWINVDAAPGMEHATASALARSLPGWKTDVRGNLVLHSGSGRPRRVVACALDVPEYVVSQVTDDGYLRLHRSGGGALHPLWDQFHEAQRVRIFTARGVVTGVVAVANAHFAREHAGDTAVVTVDRLWVDVGASSRADVQRLGVSLLDAVIAERPLWTYEGFAAGPAAGLRAGCAAMVAASSGRVRAGETTWVISTQRSFGWGGLAAALEAIGPVDALTVLDAGRAAAADASVAVSRMPGALGRLKASDSIRVVVPRVRFAGSLVESIDADDAASLAVIAAKAGGADEGNAWVRVPVDTARGLKPRADEYAALEQRFMALADLPAAPGHEWRVREAVMAALPAWARTIARVDSAGNLIVSAGPDRDSVLFIAHMDEVGFEVQRIAADGRVGLGRLGGPVMSAWEGQPAWLHFDRVADGRVPPPLRGVFVPRESARVKNPGDLTAWFGLDSAGARGARRAARGRGPRLQAGGSPRRGPHRGPRERRPHGLHCPAPRRAAHRSGPPHAQGGLRLVGR